MKHFLSIFLIFSFFCLSTDKNGAYIISAQECNDAIKVLLKDYELEKKLRDDYNNLYLGEHDICFYIKYENSHEVAFNSFCINMSKKIALVSFYNNNNKGYAICLNTIEKLNGILPEPILMHIDTTLSSLDFIMTDFFVDEHFYQKKKDSMGRAFKAIAGNYSVWNVVASGGFGYPVGLRESGKCLGLLTFCILCLFRLYEFLKQDNCYSKDDIILIKKFFYGLNLFSIGSPVSIFQSANYLEKVLVKGLESVDLNWEFDLFKSLLTQGDSPIFTELELEKLTKNF